jgi:broad specificity phosphatase PhoE
MAARTISVVTTILLARHGESDWNVEQRWQGHADRPLTDRGRAQAEELARRLDAHPLGAVYSSDLRRALDTARAVASRRGLTVAVRRDLREVDCGSWSGRLHAEIDPVEIERWKAGEKAWAGGESYAEMGARLVSAVSTVAAGHPGEQVLVVSHGAAIRAILAAALGLSFQEYRRLHPTVANTGLSAVRVDNGTIALRASP